MTAASVEAVRVACKRPYSNPDYEPRPMKEQQGWDSALEAEAKHLACGVGRYDSQPWTPAARPRIDYGPKRPHRESRQFAPSLFDAGFSTPRLAMYQHQVFPDIHVGRKPKPEKDWEPWIPTGRGEVNRKEVEYDSDDPYGPEGAGCRADNRRAQRDPNNRDNYDRQNETQAIVPKQLYAGKRDLGSEKVTMPKGTWHITGDKVSQAQVICSVCAEPIDVRKHERRYCSGECQRVGANAAKRRLRLKQKRLSNKAPADPNNRNPRLGTYAGYSAADRPESRYSVKYTWRDPRQIDDLRPLHIEVQRGVTRLTA